MLYNKHNLAVAKVASKSTFRKELASVAFFENKTVATDSFRLLEISTPKGQEINDYPTIEGIDVVRSLGETAPVLLSAKHVQALKPVKASKSLPVLNHVVLGKRGENQYELVSTNLEDTKIETVSAVRDGSYPEYEQIIPKKDPRAKIVVNGKFLAEIVTVLSGLNDLDGSVEIEIHGDREPIVLRSKSRSGQTGLGLVMPFSK